MRFADTTVKKYLYQPGAVFEIPEFQRPYSWKTVNAQEYLKDLEECVSEGKSHYFGTVVQVEDEDSDDAYSIIDGQQRVTTSLLLIFAIYHLVKQNPSLLGDSDTTPDDLLDNYLINKNRKNHRIKLRTVTTDNEILQHIFDANGDKNLLNDGDSLSSLYTVYSVFTDYFSNKVNLNKYISGLNYFKIVCITLEKGDDNPQRVFESINSTGKPLSDGDKIRNYALMLDKKNTRNRVYEKYWVAVEKSLVSVEKDYITDFFRAYIISERSGIVKLDAVYPEFKKLFEKEVGSAQEEDKIDKFYGNIIESLEFYKLLKITDLRNIDTKYAGVRETIFKMRYLQIDLYIPYALNVLRYHTAGNITPSELEEVFKLIEVYFSRRIVSGIDTTSVDRFLASLHKDAESYLNNTDPKASYTEVLKYILLNRIGQTRLPADAEYENAIRTREAYYQRNSFLTYVLTAAEESSKDAVHTLHQISSGELKLSIEHVMPQTLASKDWQEMLGSDFERIHGDYLHTLANLTLTGYNSEYSNRPYNEKMNLKIIDKKTGKTRMVGFAVAERKLPLNEWIAKHDTWNEDTLKERRKWWVKSLKKVWPMPTTTFKPVEKDTWVYLLDTADLKGKSVRSIEVFGEKTSVTTWAEALDAISEAIYGRNDSNFIEKIADDEWLSGNIRQDSSAFHNSVEILETGYFINTNNETNTKLRLISALGRVFGLSTDDIKAELTVDKNNVEEET